MNGYQDNLHPAVTTAPTPASPGADTDAAPDEGPVTDAFDATDATTFAEPPAPASTPTAEDEAPVVDTADLVTVAPDVVAETIALLEQAIASLRTLET